MYEKKNNEKQTKKHYQKIKDFDDNKSKRENEIRQLILPRR
jgi:hypothetical protein